VGAYRLLKSLVHDPHDAARPPRRGVGLSFCGCEAAAAEAAAHRLSQTARTHLSLHVEWVDSRRAMQPVNRQHLGQFNGKPLDHLWQELRGFLDGLGDTPADAGDGSLLNDAELEALHPPAPSLEAPHDDPIDTPAGPFTLHASDAAPPVQADDAESLTHLLDDLRALEARCPSRPETELAVDADGVLHLLMHDGEGPMADALSNLLATQAWATEHAVLLSLTDPQAALDPSAAPVAHLFTARPREAAAIAFAGGPGRRPFKLHLLKPVRVDGRTIRVHEPLN